MEQARLRRAQQSASSVDGWLTTGEGELLFALAAKCPPDAPIVEIGSCKGKSTIFLAAGAGDSATPRVFAIDPHEGSLEDPAATRLAALRANLEAAGVAKSVVPIVARSHDAAACFAERPGLVFIDGNHLEDAVRVDLEDWLPKVLDGGVVALHDVLNGRWAGPRRAVAALLWRSTEISPARFTDSIAWMRKVGRNTWRDRARNRFAAMLLTAYGVKARGLPGPVLAALRVVYRRTPLKRQAREG